VHAPSQENGLCGAGQLTYQTAVAPDVAAAILTPDSVYWVTQHETCVEA